VFRQCLNHVTVAVTVSLNSNFTALWQLAFLDDACRDTVYSSTSRIQQRTLLLCITASVTVTAAADKVPQVAQAELHANAVDSPDLRNRGRLLGPLGTLMSSGSLASAEVGTHLLYCTVH
jgi:hypothetical protein